MHLNLTFFVQMAHFMIAYVILEKLFFRVAVARMKADDRRSLALETQIEQLTIRVGQQVQNNEQNWSILCKRLKSESPVHSIGNKTPVSVSQSPQLHHHHKDMPFEETVSSFVQQIEKSIIQQKEKDVDS